MAEPTKATETTAESPSTSQPEHEVPRLKVLTDLFTKNYPSSRSCFVLGGTGETGRRIASLLIESGAFALVRLIVRHQVSDDILPEPPAGVKLVR